MSITPEKNDVDISKLFEYTREIKLYGSRGKRKTVYMRLLGDAEVNRARVKALRKSAELRKKLSDTDSDEYVALIPDVGDATREKLISLIVMMDTKEITTMVRKEIDVPFPNVPGEDATLEEEEKYQKAVDEYPERLRNTIKAEVIERLSKRKDVYKDTTKEELISYYVNLFVSEICETEMYRYFYYYSVFFSLYQDEEFTQRLYTDFQEFDNLPTQVKSNLVDNYHELELGLEDLKK